MLKPTQCDCRSNARIDAAGSGDEAGVLSLKQSRSALDKLFFFFVVFFLVVNERHTEHINKGLLSLNQPHHLTSLFFG